jgi:hypothetical protein
MATRQTQKGARKMDATFTVKTGAGPVQICKVLPSGRNIWLLEDFETIQSAIDFLKEKYDNPEIMVREW